MFRQTLRHNVYGKRAGRRSRDSIAAVLKKAGWDVTLSFTLTMRVIRLRCWKVSRGKISAAIHGEDSVAFPEDGYHGDDVKELASEFAREHGDKYLNADSELRREAMTSLVFRAT
jgi:arginyl-tRNA synthetase